MLGMNKKSNAHPLGWLLSKYTCTILYLALNQALKGCFLTNIRSDFGQFDQKKHFEFVSPPKRCIFALPITTRSLEGTIKWYRSSVGRAKD